MMLKTDDDMFLRRLVSIKICSAEAAPTAISLEIAGVEMEKNYWQEW
jgi:hypothetical protein